MSGCVLISENIEYVGSVSVVGTLPTRGLLQSTKSQVIWVPGNQISHVTGGWWVSHVSFFLGFEMLLMLKSCTTWDVKSHVNNGINCQPQLVSRISEPSTVSQWTLEVPDRSAVAWNCWWNKPLLKHWTPSVNINFEVLYLTGWWFQIFFIFTPSWGNDPIWLIFFRWVETTNQLMLGVQNPLDESRLSEKTIILVARVIKTSRADYFLKWSFPRLRGYIFNPLEVTLHPFQKIFPWKCWWNVFP